MVMYHIKCVILRARCGLVAVVKRGASTMSDAHQHTEPGADPGELSMVRSLLGLTQQQMAEELGISMRSIQEYEAGRNRTPPFIRQALHLITIKTALKRRNPLLMTETTGRLVDDTA